MVMDIWMSLPEPGGIAIPAIQHVMLKLLTFIFGQHAQFVSVELGPDLRVGATVCHLIPLVSKHSVIIVLARASVT